MSIEKWPLFTFLALFTAGFLLSCSNPDHASSPPSENTNITQSASRQINFTTVLTQMKSAEIQIRGRLKSDQRLEIFPEVQGKILPGTKAFREGVAFKKGEAILQLDDREHRLQLQSTRNQFKTLIASLMPDIKLDYPEKLETVEQWYNEIKNREKLPVPPEFNNSQLHRYLTSKGVYEKYFQIKSAEERLEKFTLTAPFTGVVAAANAEPGQSVSPQTHLGTLVNPRQFVLTASVPANRVEFLTQTSKSLTVTNEAQTRQWEAVIRRVNPSVDGRTQSVEIYLELSGDELREGMYLEGSMASGEKTAQAAIPKTALLRTGHVYLKKDGAIHLTPVEVMDVEREQVWVRGLNDGDQIVRTANRPLGGVVMEKE